MGLHSHSWQGPQHVSLGPGSGDATAIERCICGAWRIGRDFDRLEEPDQGGGEIFLPGAGVAKARELEEAAAMLERQRNEVQTKREEVETDLAEERRIHRQDVDELKRKMGLEQGRARDAAIFAEGQVEEISRKATEYEQRAYRAEATLRKADDLIERWRDGGAGGVVEFVDGLQAEIRKTVEFAGDFHRGGVVPPESAERERGIVTAGPGLVVDLGWIPILTSDPTPAYYRSKPRRDGISFVKVDPDELAAELGVKADLEALRQLDEARTELREIARRLEAAEEAPLPGTTAAAFEELRERAGDLVVEVVKAILPKGR